jgi:hypothetical protein
MAVIVLVLLLVGIGVSVREYNATARLLLATVIVGALLFLSLT